MNVLALGGTSDIALAAIRAIASAPEGDAPHSAVTAVIAARSDLTESQQQALDHLDVATTWVSWDATDTSSTDRHIGELFDKRGPFDLVICAVGMLGHHAGVSMQPAQVEAMLLTNTVGPAVALSACAHRLVDQGHGTMVVLSSVAGARARRSNFVYGASKAGLDSFCEGLGDALEQHGVHVVVVRPGFVRSKMTAGLEPAPMSTDPDSVGRAIARAVRAQRTHTIWVPARLGPLMTALSIAPRPLWRRIAGNR